MESSSFYTIKQSAVKSSSVSVDAIDHTDLLFVCNGGKKYEAHRSVFSSHSQFLKNALSGHECKSRSVLYVPDYNYEDIANLVSLLYVGFVCLPADDVASLQQIMRDFSVDLTKETPSVKSRANLLTDSGFIYDESAVNSVGVVLQRGEAEQFRRRTEAKRIKLEVAPKPIGQVETQEISVRPCTPDSIVNYFDTQEGTSSSLFRSEEPESDEENMFATSCSEAEDQGRPNNPNCKKPRAPQIKKGRLKRGKRKSACLVCGEDFSYKTLLIHMKKEHDYKGKIYFCSFCAVVLTSSTERSRHEEAHPENMEMCEMCDFEAPRRKMQMHKEKMHFSKMRLFKCEICNESLPTSEKYHHLRTHSETVLRYSCQHCSKIYYRHNSLLQHIASVHCGKIRYRCTVCKKQFESLQECEEHRKTHGKRPGKVCPVCSGNVSGMMYFNHLKKHAAHEVGLGDPLTCPRCERTFQNPEHTQNHLIAHLDPPRPNECDICFLPSKTAALVEQHKMRQHGALKPHVTKCKPEKSVRTCPRCDKLVQDGERYKKHLVSHAWFDLGCGDENDEVTCPVCCRTFSCGLYAANHYLCHYETDRVYECDRCFLPVQTEMALSFHQSRCIGKRGKVKKGRAARVEKQILAETPGAVAWLCSECACVFETEKECEVHCALFHSYEEIVF